MRISFLLFIFQFIVFNSNAQIKWCNPKPSGWSNLKIFFLNNNSALMFANDGDLFRTTDTANNWQLQQNFPGGQTFSLKDSTGIIPGLNGIVYLTTDNGTTWQQKQTGINAFYAWADVVSRDTIFLVSDIGGAYSNKLYRSSDRGNTWQLINNDLQMLLYTLDFANSQVGYGRRPGGISKTTDGGVTWQVQYPITTTANITTLKFLNPNIGFAYRQTGQMLRTVDGGSTWTGVNTTVTSDLNDIYFLNATTAFACGENGEVEKTTDGGSSWTPVYSGAPAAIFYSLYFFNDQSGFVVGLRGDIWRTADGGATWQPHSPTYIDLRDISFGNNNTGYTITRDQIYKTTDKGDSWTALSFTLPSPSNSYLDFCTFFSSDTGIVTSSMYPKVYRTTNGGQNWTTFSFNQGFYYDIRGLSFANSHTGYISVNGPLHDLFRTVDGGISWQKAGDNQDFRSLHFVNDSVGYATQYYSVWRTLDSGKNWTQKLFTDLGTDDAIWFLNAKKGFVGGGQGNLNMTTDSGTTWTTPMIYDNQNAYFLDMRFFNDTVGYFTTQFQKLYKTIDGGVTWRVWAQTPWNCESIWFTKDTTIYLAGRNGDIIKARVDEYRIDSLKASSNSQCNLSFSAKITSVISPVDSIWFQYGTTDYANTIIASPTSVLNATVLSVATPQGLLSNTQYILRVRVLYKGNYYYSDSIHFNTPVLIVPSITANGNLLTSSVTSGNQWLLNGVTITGAINQQYTATTSGIYTVQVITNGCVAISPPYNYMITAVVNLPFNNEIQVFPNPVSNILTIKNPAGRKLKIRLSDLQGKILKQYGVSVQQYYLSLNFLPSGVYLLYLVDTKTGQTTTGKIVKL